MKNALIKRIEALSNEATQLMQLRSKHEEAIRDIEIRLHQIAGAITELDAMIKEEPGEAGSDRK